MPRHLSGGPFLALHLQSKFGSFHIGARYVLLTLNVCGTQTGSKGNAKPKMWRPVGPFKAPVGIGTCSIPTGAIPTSAIPTNVTLCPQLQAYWSVTKMCHYTQRQYQYPYCQRQICRLLSIVSGGIRFMRIFVEVPWQGPLNDSGVVENGNFQRFRWLFLRIL